MIATALILATFMVYCLVGNGLLVGVVRRGERRRERVWFLEGRRR